MDPEMDPVETGTPLVTIANPIADPKVRKGLMRLREKLVADLTVTVRALADINTKGDALPSAEGLTQRLGRIQAVVGVLDQMLSGPQTQTKDVKE